MTTFWAKVPQFPDIKEGNVVELDPYLNAAEGATTIFDLLGVAFAPVKNDMTGNIKKLKGRRDKNTEKFTSVNAILQDEKDTNCSKEGQTGALWLTRALLFIQKFLQHLVESVKNDPNEQKLRPLLMKAYDETLKQYHGFIVKTMFSTVSRAAPYRPDLMKLLALDKEGMEDQVLQDIETYLMNLTKTNEVIIKLLKDLGQFSEEKV